MAILKYNDVLKLSRRDMEKKISELQLELAKEKANIHIGANVTSPGKIKEIRRTIARIKTAMKSQEENN